MIVRVVYMPNRPLAIWSRANDPCSQPAPRWITYATNVMKHPHIRTKKISALDIEYDVMPNVDKLGFITVCKPKNKTRNRWTFIIFTSKDADEPPPRGITRIVSRAPIWLIDSKSTSLQPPLPISGLVWHLDAIPMFFLNAVATRNRFALQPLHCTVPSRTGRRRCVEHHIEAICRVATILSLIYCWRPFPNAVLAFRSKPQVDP